jgi:hypothetical protein
MYKVYCNGYEASAATLQRLESNKKWVAFRDTQLSGTVGKGATLAAVVSMLIMPMQRIPRYVLLVRELIKHTWPEHPDMPNLQRALKLYSGIAMEINNSATKMEAVHNMHEAERHFGAHLHILKRSRTLVRQYHLPLLLCLSTSANKANSKDAIRAASGSSESSGSTGYVSAHFAAGGDQQGAHNKYLLFVFNDLLLLARQHTSSISRKSSAMLSFSFTPVSTGGYGSLGGTDAGPAADWSGKMQYMTHMQMGTDIVVVDVPDDGRAHLRNIVRVFALQPRAGGGEHMLTLQASGVKQKKELLALLRRLQRALLLQEGEAANRREAGRGRWRKLRTAVKVTSMLKAAGVGKLDAAKGGDSKEGASESDSKCSGEGNGDGSGVDAHTGSGAHGGKEGAEEGCDLAQEETVLLANVLVPEGHQASQRRSSLRIRRTSQSMKSTRMVERWEQQQAGAAEVINGARDVSGGAGGGRASGIDDEITKGEWDEEPAGVRHYRIELWQQSRILHSPPAAEGEAEGAVKEMAVETAQSVRVPIRVPLRAYHEFLGLHALLLARMKQAEEEWEAQSLRGASAAAGAVARSGGRLCRIRSCDMPELAPNAKRKDAFKVELQALMLAEFLQRLLLLEAQAQAQAQAQAKAMGTAVGTGVGSPVLECLNRFLGLHQLPACLQLRALLMAGHETGEASDGSQCTAPDLRRSDSSGRGSGRSLACDRPVVKAVVSLQRRQRSSTISNTSLSHSPTIAKSASEDPSSSRSLGPHTELDLTPQRPSLEANDVVDLPPAVYITLAQAEENECDILIEGQRAGDHQHGCMGVYLWNSDLRMWRALGGRDRYLYATGDGAANSTKKKKSKKKKKAARAAAAAVGAAPTCWYLSHSEGMRAREREGWVRVTVNGARKRRENIRLQDTACPPPPDLPSAPSSYFEKSGEEGKEAAGAEQGSQEEGKSPSKEEGKSPSKEENLRMMSRWSQVFTLSPDGGDSAAATGADAGAGAGEVGMVNEKGEEAEDEKGEEAWHWQVFDGVGWAEAPTIQVRVCSQAEKAVAKRWAVEEEKLAVAQAREVGDVVVEGQRPGEHQHGCMGVYELMSGVSSTSTGDNPVMVNGRAVWRAMRAGDLYLYYGSNRRWYIGNGASMRRGKAVGGVCVSSDAFTPDIVTEAWQVRSREPILLPLLKSTTPS